MAGTGSARPEEALLAIAVRLELPLQATLCLSPEDGPIVPGLCPGPGWENPPASTYLFPRESLWAQATFKRLILI